jgi:glycosyltransferase involved in cell wall biosynthesis
MSPATPRDAHVFGDADVIHNFGTWTLFNHRISVRARRAQIPQVFCPMGMLEPWSLAQKPVKKRIGWMLYQRHDIECSSAIHATARSEAENLRALGIKAPIVVIPRGIDIPTHQPARQSLQMGSSEKTILFLSRIHPKKGLFELVQACTRLKTKNWKVIIAGPDTDSYQAVIEKAVTSAQLQDKFNFVGPVYGEQKSSLFLQADLFVLPTHSENFGVVIAEALAHGVPVITTTGTPWVELNEAGCGWWIPTGAAALETTLSEAISMPSSALAEMGVRGRALVEARYTWPAIIRKHIALYEWLIGGGQRPDFFFD